MTQEHELESELLPTDTPHTKVKHELYKQYLNAWLPILMNAVSDKVRIVDGFAGPGRYRETSREGSPQIAIRAASEHERLLETKHNIEVFIQCIEKKKERAEHLKKELQNLSRAKFVRYDVRTGDFSTVWTQELENIRKKGGTLEPTLLFIDAYGYSGFPMELITQTLEYRSCEILINFPWQSINQWALQNEDKHQALDELYGNSEWRRGKDIQDSHEREEFFVGHYQRSLAQKGWKGTTFRMVNKNNQTSYYLVFGTTHPRGMEAFKTAAWKVQPKGRFEFSDLENPAQHDFLTKLEGDTVTEELKRKLITKHMGQNVEYETLKEQTAWHPMARETHLRKSLKLLESEGYVPRVDSRGRKGSFPPKCIIHFRERQYQPSLF